MRIKFTVLLLLYSCITFAQNKFYKNIDTTYTGENSYIASNDVETFFESGVADVQIPLEGVNEELLTATLFFCINEWRTKRKKGVLTLHPKLQITANQYTRLYSAHSLMTAKNLTRGLSKYTKTLGFKGALVKGAKGAAYIRQYKKHQGKYHFKNRTEQFFLGRKPRGKRKSKEKEIELLPHTYLTLAQELFKQIKLEKGFIGIEGYTEIGCVVKVNTTPFAKYKKIPQARVMVILGGYRLRLLHQ